MLQNAGYLDARDFLNAFLHLRICFYAYAFARTPFMLYLNVYALSMLFTICLKFLVTVRSYCKVQLLILSILLINPQVREVCD